MRRFFPDLPAQREARAEPCALRLTSEYEFAVDRPPLSLPARIELLERRMMLSVASPNYLGGVALPVFEPPVVVSGGITGAVPAPMAVASDIAQLVNLSWPSVAGATGYELQRSDDGGTTWKSVGSSSLSADDTSASDYDYNNGARLLASTSYQYRLAALDVRGVSHLSPAVTVTTSSKRLYDDTFLVGKPDLSPYGLNKSETSGSLEKTATTALGVTEVFLDQNAFDAAAAKAYADHAIFVLDLENLKLLTGIAGQVLGASPPTDPVQQVITNLTALVTAIDLTRAAVPGVQIGLHAMGTTTPVESAARGDFDAALWSGLNLYQSQSASRDSSYDLLSRLDMVSPESYLGLGQTLVGWAGGLAAQTQQWRANLLLDGHGATPIVPALSPFLYSDTAPVAIAADTWTAMLAAANVDPNSNGIRIWGAQQGQFGAENWAGPDQQAWWNGTLQVIGETTGALAGSPTIVPSLATQGSMSWSYSGGAADGFLVERSADGQWPATLSYDSTQSNCAFLVAGGSLVTWVDASAQSGASYWYRVCAISSGSTSDWSAAWQAASPLDATAPLWTFPNPISQWTSASNASNYANGVALGGTATLYYRAMDFGQSGVDQVTVDIAEWTPGNEYAGGTLEVFIDRDPSAPGSAPSASVPMTDDVHAGPTAIDVNVSGAIPLTRGVHAVWLRFVPPADHPWASAAARSVQFSASQSSNVVLSAGASASYYLKLDGDDQTLDVWQNADPTQSAPSARYILSNIRSLLIQGAGDTSLIVDDSNGNPLPACPLNFAGGSGANRLEIIGSGGDDVFLYQGQLLDAGGTWSSNLLFNWHTLNLPNNVSVSYRTGGGTDVVGIRSHATLTLLADPATGSGPQPIRLSALTLGVGATLIAPSSGIIDTADPMLSAASQRSVLVVDSLAMMAGGNLSSIDNPLLLGTLDLGGSDMIVNHLDLFGFDIDPFANAVTQSDLQRAAVSQGLLNTLGWTGQGITSSTAIVNTPTADGIFDGIALSPPALLFQTT